MGMARYRKALLEGGDDRTTPGITLIKRAIEPMKAAVTAYIAGIKDGKAARLGGTVAFLEQFEVDELAFLTAKTLIHAVSKRMTLQAVADALGRSLEEQTDIETLKDDHPGLYRRFLDKLKQYGPGKRAVLIRAQHAYAGIRPVSWGVSERRRVGVTLIHMFSEATGLVGVELLSAGASRPGHKLHFVVPTPATEEWLAKAHHSASLMQPVFMPMVTPPLDWKGPYGGGYLTRKLQYPVIRGGTSRNFLEELKSIPMDMEYRALNALQSTAWVINRGILRTMEEAWLTRKLPIGGLPPFNNLDLPPQEFTEADAAANADNFIAWKRRAAEVHDANKRRLPGQRSQMTFLLAMANRFQAEDAIYFPHMMDWRGRKYAVSSYLNPQGNDLAKALITFAHSKPLGDNGQYWLAVHGANTFGIDKVSFEERVRWVQDHEEQIMESGLNPLDGTQWWAEADAPFQFLAFCKEWFALNMHIKHVGTPETFESSLPVSWDGSCNGLQNFAAMVKDPVGGAAVNLTPNDVPSDVYKLVANRANEQVEQDAAEGHELADRWVGKLTRKLCKQNTMTVPYGVTKFGMRDQQITQYRGDKAKAEDAGQKLDYEMTPDDATYIAGVNYKAIGTVVQSAHAVMAWLQQVARIAAEGNLPVHWVTPSGFNVLQSYKATEGKRLDLVVLGQRYQLMFSVELEKLDKRRQASGISPNFVHSLDAAHLTRTVDYCLAAGITSFAMVHDSYGTHAGDADTLSHLLRRAFVDQYSGNVLADFLEQIRKQLPEKLASKLPQPPAQGALDLEGVMDSLYFFA